VYAFLFCSIYFGLSDAAMLTNECFLLEDILDICMILVLRWFSISCYVNTGCFLSLGISFVFTIFMVLGGFLLAIMWKSTLIKFPCTGLSHGQRRALLSQLRFGYQRPCAVEI
jgi:hypothetical protein